MRLASRAQSLPTSNFFNFDFLPLPFSTSQHNNIALCAVPVSTYEMEETGTNNTGKLLRNSPTSQNPLST